MSERAPRVERVLPLPPDARGRPREALLVRTAGGERRCYLNLCQHLPVPLDAGSREFLSADGEHLVCGTHGALYRFEDGYCTAGPCEGTSLVALPFTIREDGSVEVTLPGKAKGSERGP